MDPRLLLALLAASRGAGAAPAVAPLRLRARALAAQPHDDDRSWVEAMIGAPGTAAETIYLAPVEAAASASAVVADFRGEGGISHIIVPAEQGVAAPVKIFDSLLAVWRLFFSRSPRVHVLFGHLASLCVRSVGGRGVFALRLLHWAISRALMRILSTGP